MAVTTDDLLFPNGRLDPSVMWPLVSEDTVTEYLDAFLLAGVAKTAEWDAEDQDAGTKAWAEYRGLDSVIRQTVYSLNSATFVDEGSGAISVEQMRLMILDRDAALLEFTELEDAATAEDPLRFTTLKSLRD